MNINEAKLFLELLSQKTQSGGFTPIQFNLAAQRAQIQLFEKDFKYWQATEETTEALGYFINELVPLPIDNNGEVPYPSDYYHLIEMRRYYPPMGVPVHCDEIEASEVGSLVVSQLSPATERFPKFVEYDLKFQVFPRQAGTAIIDYFRTPVTPVWGYTVTNGVAVYNPAASTNFEMPDFAHNALVGIMCQYLGINIREGMLLEFAEVFKQQNQQ